jgi:glycosyltransferase involved in cell wall biosynthesis
VAPERIRILRVTEQASLGGEQTDVLHLLEELDPARYEQTACSEPAGPFVDEVKRLSIPHIPVTMRSKFDLSAILRLRQVIRAGGYDIVHLHGARAGLLGRIAAQLAGAPLVVWTMHVFQMDVLQGGRHWQGPLYLLVEDLLARGFCDHVITVSENLRQRTLALQHVPAHKITTIYSHVDLRPFDHPLDSAEKRRELGLPLDVPVICTVGRLCAGKGLPDFLYAAAHVHAQMPEVRFVVVGDGPLRGELESLATQLGLDGCLTFTGHRDDVAGMLFASDVFATATLWEGFGKVNVEAMAAGRPLVSTNVGAIREVVGDYRGAILVPPHDPTLFAEALLTILRDLPDYARWAEEGRQRAYALFGRDTLAQRTSALYEQLIDARWPERAREVYEQPNELHDG